MHANTIEHIVDEWRKKRSSILFVIIVVCIGAIVGVIVRNIGLSNSKYSHNLVDFGLKDVGKLVTQEGCYTSIQTLGDSRIVLGLAVPFTERKYVYSLDGIVSAGIDFDKIILTPDESNKTLRIQLPPAEIFNVVPDENSFTIYHEGDNLFNGLHIEELSESRKEMEIEIREKALAYNILEHATDNAKTLISTLISQTFDLNTWKIEFVSLEEA